jgi:hypothetical protein
MRANGDWVRINRDNKNRLVAWAGLVALLLGSGDWLKAQEVTLRIQPEVGLVSQYSTELKFWVVSAMIPQADPSAPLLSQTGNFTQTVTGVSGGLTTLRAEMNSSRFSMPPGMGVSPPNLAGLTILIAVDPRGRVVESTVDPATVPPTVRGLEEQVRQMIAGMSLNFPAGPVAIGASWTSSNRETIAGPVGPMVTANEVQYTLKNVDYSGGTRVAFIGIEGSVSQRSDEESAVPVMLSIDIAGTLTGEFVVDLDVGRVLSFSNASRLEGEVRVGNSTSGMPILVTSTTNINLLDQR